MESGENNMGSNDGPNSKASLAARQRLRWTDELHEQFVEAVTQLGGPDSTYPHCNCASFLLLYDTISSYCVVTLWG